MHCARWKSFTKEYQYTCCCTSKAIFLVVSISKIQCFALTNIMHPHCYKSSGPVFTAVKTASVFLLVPDKKSQDKLLKFRHEIDGTLTRIGGPNFSDILVKELHGNLPGDYYKPRPLPPKLLRTAVNARAREGSIYWYMEKPPPKSKCWVTLLTG